jgi:hypothetical protein
LLAEACARSPTIALAICSGVSLAVKVEPPPARRRALFSASRRATSCCSTAALEVLATAGWDEVAPREARQCGSTVRG